jgi:glycyl-tRNA synthetase alpha subunit
MMKTFLVVIVVALLAGVFRAPAFLVCERPLEKADCVMVMLGSEFEARKREAVSLIEKGVADTLLIPAWRKVVRCEGGSRKLTEKKMVAVAARPQVSVRLFGRRLDLYENTPLNYCWPER